MSTVKNKLCQKQEVTCNYLLLQY